jgi:hypothetical protein
VCVCVCVCAIKVWEAEDCDCLTTNPVHKINIERCGLSFDGVSDGASCPHQHKSAIKALCVIAANMKVECRMSNVPQCTQPWKRPSCSRTSSSGRKPRPGFGIRFMQRRRRRRKSSAVLTRLVCVCVRAYMSESAARAFVRVRTCGREGDMRQRGPHVLLLNKTPALCRMFISRSATIM